MLKDYISLNYRHRKGLIMVVFEDKTYYSAKELVRQGIATSAARITQLKRSCGFPEGIWLSGKMHYNAESIHDWLEMREKKPIKRFYHE